MKKLILLLFLFGSFSASFAQNEYYFKSTKGHVSEQIKCNEIVLILNPSQAEDTITASLVDSVKAGFEKMGFKCSITSNLEEHESKLAFIITRKKSQRVPLFLYGIYPSEKYCHVFELEQASLIPDDQYRLWTIIKLTAKRYTKGLDQMNEKLANNIAQSLAYSTSSVD